MPFEIKRESIPPRVIRMGHAPQPIESRPFDQPVRISQTAIDDAGPEDDYVERQLAEIVTPPAAKPERQRGRPKKMADKKLDHESGAKTIRQDDAGEQGAIGSHGENALAQEQGGTSEADKGSKEGE